MLIYKKYVIFIYNWLNFYPSDVYMCKDKKKEREKQIFNTLERRFFIMCFI